MIFTGTFKTFDNSNEYSVTIGNTGTTTVITDPSDDSVYSPATDMVVMFDPDPVTITCDRGDLQKRIIISQATINLVSNENLTNYLFADTNRSIPVNVVNTDTNDLCFFGYVDPLQFSQGYAYNWESIQVTATDPLGALESLTVGDLTGVTATSTLTSWTLITDILSAAGISTINRGINNTVYNALTGTKVKMSIFFGESQDDWMTLYDTLSEICKYFSLYVSYYDGGAYIMSTINFNSTQFAIANFKSAAADSSTNISVDTAYSQATLTCEIEPVEDIVISFDNDDYLYSEYSNYEKYMTEYISAGEGERAYSGFKDLVNTGVTAYDAGYYIDNFVWVRKNHAWDFGTQGYDKQSFQSQLTYLTWLKHNSGKGALLSFGRGKKLNLQDNSPITNISLTDYLVIPINGTYDDTTAGMTTMENMISAANPVCTYKGLNSAILSPPDANVTNYIIISGQIMLNPLQPMTGPQWGSESQKLNNTLIQCHEILNSSWPTSERLKYKTVPHPDNDDGAYYQQNWITGTNGLHGYLDNSKNQRFEYKYSKEGGAIDTISKVPILACSLKVGTKYCVERLDLGQQGVGLFQWKTAAECESLGIEPYFTIGIDPKTGDKIIGVSHNIQNNINYTQNVESTGTAIPIRASDRLSGEIEFKILGPYNTVWDEVTDAMYFAHHFFNTPTIVGEPHSVLQYIQSIMVSNFKIETKSDNGLISENMTNADNDLVYSSDMHPEYTEKLEEDVKICTPLTLEECTQWGIKYQISNSYVYKTNDDPFYGFQSGANTIKPEDCVVDYFYNEYCTPAKMISTSLKTSTFGTDGINGSQLTNVMMKDYITGVYKDDNSAYRIMSYDTSLKQKASSMTFRQYKTQGHTQI